MVGELEIDMANLRVELKRLQSMEVELATLKTTLVTQDTKVGSLS